ncbi:hypothetical protein FRC00_010847 [Tulasnella sp. 408]|nr:hypothetical protein FRC00_010847 [Tulasnella sp. 408]
MSLFNSTVPSSKDSSLSRALYPSLAPPQDALSITTDSQFPDCMSYFIMKARNKITRDARVLLTVNEVVTALEIRRAVVPPDERTGHSRVRSSDNESSVFLRRFRERGLPGFTTRGIERKDEERERLSGVISDFMGLRNGSGHASASQPQTSVEEQPEALSTSHSPQLQFAENLGSGNGESSTWSLGLGRPRPPTDSESPRAPSPCTVVLDLGRIDSAYTPPFTEIRALGLTNGIQLRYMEAITSLRHSSNLSKLHLVNIKFVGGEAQVVEEVVLLPGLTELVFAELIEPIELGLLWLSPGTPACSKLHLDLRPSAAIMRHTALPARAAPTVRKALPSNSKSFLLFRCNTNTQSATWEVARRG